MAELSKHDKNATVLVFNRRHKLYHALAMMAAYPDASQAAQSSYRAEIKRLLAQMKRYTRVAPESTMAKYCLMQGEWARLHRVERKALRWFDEAARSAQAAGYPREVALANELAALACLTLGNAIQAETYLRHACYAYFQWGALGKIAALKERFPALRSLHFEEEENREAQAELADAEAAAAAFVPEPVWDVETLRQTTRIASGGEDAAELLDSFLDAAIRLAGAESGVILLNGGGKLQIEAERDVNLDMKQPAPETGMHSPAIVQFAMRTKEPFVLGDVRQSPFAADPYIRRQAPRSVLILPIHFPAHREGVLYLENRLTSNAFTTDLLEVLEIAFSRIAYIRLRQISKPAGGAAEAETAPAKRMPALVEPLTDRETDIIRLMAEGMSNREIGEQLNITEGTVKNHAFNIFGKLQVKRRGQAVTKARELQLLD